MKQVYGAIKLTFKKPMNNLESISKYVSDFRELVEPFWSEDMLYEKFAASADDTKSAGYCGPSSVLLFKRLKLAYPQEKFSLAVGRVYKDKSGFIKGKHVWIVLHNKLRGSVIIDVTADQSKKIDEKIIVEDIDKLAKDDINYIAYQLAHDLEDVDESPKRRAQLLEEKIG